MKISSSSTITHILVILLATMTILSSSAFEGVGGDGDGHGGPAPAPASSSSSSSSSSSPSKNKPPLVDMNIVDEWLVSQSLNEYGDPMDTAYAGGNPLFDMTTGEFKDRYEYLLEKFPTEPWGLSSSSSSSSSSAGPDDDNNVVDDDDHSVIIDDWLKSKCLNEFGDSLDTAYVGGSPLWDFESGEIRDRYEYLIEKFPHQPWLDGDDDEAWAEMDDGASSATAAESAAKQEQEDDIYYIYYHNDYDNMGEDDLNNANAPAKGHGQGFDMTTNGGSALGHVGHLPVSSSIALSLFLTINANH